MKKSLLVTLSLIVLFCLSYSGGLVLANPIGPHDYTPPGVVVVIMGAFVFLLALFGWFVMNGLHKRRGKR